MNSRALAATATVLLLGAVGACSSADSNTEAPRATPVPAASPKQAAPSIPTTEPTTEEPTEPVTPERNERGNLVKALGEDGGATDETTGDRLFDFTITAIEPNFECTNEFAEPPVNRVGMGLLT